jgi:FtsP/CotA-like multicopper oxidase with cupredoxin domain
MTEDPLGLEEARRRGIELDDVGQDLLYEDDSVRVWGIALDPGGSQPFHFHRHPYVVISVGGDANQVETIFGDTRDTLEPAGNVVVRDEKGPVHRLVNVSDTPYRCRLIEIKTEEWTSE